MAMTSAMAVPVTYETRAKLLPRILKDIASQTGEKYDLDPRFENEILQLKLVGVDSEEVHQKLARVLGGTWERSTDGKLRLTRSDEQNREFRERERAAIAGLWKDSRDAPSMGMPEEVFEEMVDPDEPTTAPTPEEAERAKNIEAMSKAQAAIAEAMFNELSKMDISRMAIFERWGFSSVPRGRQVRAFSSLRPQLEALQRAMAAAKYEAPPAIGVKATIERTDVFSFNIQMEFVYDSEQKFERNIGSRQLGPNRVFLNTSRPLRETRPDWPKLNDPEKIVQFPKELAAFQRIVSQMEANAAPAQDGFEEAFKFLLNPLDSEPLGTVPAEALLMAAKDLGKQNIVAVLPDDALEFFMRGDANPKPLGQAIETMLRSSEADISADGTFLLVEPYFKASSHLNRLDRVVLQRMLNLRAEQGGYTLNQVAEFASTYPELSPGLFMMYSVVAQIGVSPFVMGQGDSGMHAFRFYHSLAQVDRDLLLSGGTINVARLQPSQRTLFERMTPRFTALTESPSAEGSEMNFFSSFGMARMMQGLQEPKEVDILEVTAADISRLSIVGQSLGEPVVSLAAPAGFLSFFGPMSARTIAQFDLMASMQEETPELSGAGLEMFKMPNAFREGRADVLSLRVMTGNAFGAQTYLRTSMVNPKGPVLSMDQLSPALKAEIEKSKKRLQELMSGMREDGPID